MDTMVDVLLRTISVLGKEMGRLTPPIGFSYSHTSSGEERADAMSLLGKEMGAPNSSGPPTASGGREGCLDGFLWRERRAAARQVGQGKRGRRQALRRG
jgi:hypothetical protein